ncbi:DUF4352 domain-containing protein [Mycolicibacterium boenickei]|nr:DUF4352 domain-containing protein [Mycolicibacterium boenickei]
MTTPAPGWYPDPSGAPGQRYWDGTQWGPMVPLPKKSNAGKVVLIVIAAIIGLSILAFGGCVALISSSVDSVSSSTKSTTAPTANSQPAAEAAPTVAPPPPAGAPVRDGQFEFQVTNVSSAKTVGDNPYLQSTAQGVYVIFTIRVTNTGDEPRDFFVNNQKLLDMNDRKYEASSRAGMNLNDNASGINPGNSIEVKVPFDVPQEMDMKALELHDSMFSGGVLTPASAG